LKADPTRSLLNRQRFHTHQGFPQWADLSRKTPPSSRQTAPLAYRNARSVDPFAAAPLRAARKDTTVHASLPSLHCQRAPSPSLGDEPGTGRSVWLPRSIASACPRKRRRQSRVPRWRRDEPDLSSPAFLVNTGSKTFSVRRHAARSGTFSETVRRPTKVGQRGPAFRKWRWRRLAVAAASTGAI